MSLFRFRWLRRLIRRNTTPIPEDRAKLWQQRLSIAYMLVGWNALGIIIYLYATGKPDLAKYYGLRTEEELSKRPAIYFAELLGIKKAHIITIKGFRKVDEFDYDQEKYNEQCETSLKSTKKQD